MIQKSKILSIMLISCVISSLFAISFSSTSTECECDLTEVELNIQTLNSSISTLNDSISFANSQITLINNTLNDLGNISEIMNNITYISEYLNNVTNSIENITILYNQLVENFTNYVELLESFGNVTALIDSINDAIAIIEEDISDIQSDLSTLQTNLDKYNQIGSGNSVWMPLIFQYAEPLDSFRSADYAICNTGANDMILTYVLTIPTNSGGKYLYISGFRILLSDADSTDYITSVGVYRILYNNVNQISLDTTDLTSAQLKEKTFAAVDCHLYNMVIVKVSCFCTTSNECDVRGVLLRYYYA